MLSNPAGNADGEVSETLRDASQQQIRVIDCRRFSRLLIITSRLISRRCTLRRRTHHTILSLDGRCILNSHLTSLTLAASHPATNHVRHLEADHQPWSPV